MDSSVASPVVKPPSAEQTAKRTGYLDQLKSLAFIGARRTMSPTSTRMPASPLSTAHSPQDPSPAKITSDIPTETKAVRTMSHQPFSTTAMDQTSSRARAPTQTPTPSATPLEPEKSRGIAVSAKIQEAQRLWESKQGSSTFVSTEPQVKEADVGSGAQSGTPDIKLQSSKSARTESPIPLPDYAQSLVLKRPATDMNGFLETSASKRQLSDSVSHDLRQRGVTSANPNSAAAGSTTYGVALPDGSVDIDGDVVRIIESTYSRKYTEFLVPSNDNGIMEIASTRGALLPDEYKHLGTSESPWVCPVRDCSKRMRDLRGLGGHSYAAHNGTAFNDNRDGTISALGRYRKLPGKSAPPVIVSCNPIASDAPPRRAPWMSYDKPKSKLKSKPLNDQNPTPAPIITAPQPSTDIVAQYTPPDTESLETVEYLHQFLSIHQTIPDKPDVNFMRNLPRLRDLPDVWLTHHQGEVLDYGHYVSALAYLVGEEVIGNEACRQNDVRNTARLADKCIELPSNMPQDASEAFSRMPKCVGCRYWQHLQRRTNDCDWNPERGGSKRKRSKQTPLNSEEGESDSTTNSTTDSVDSVPIKARYSSRLTGDANHDRLGNDSIKKERDRLEKIEANQQAHEEQRLRDSPIATEQTNAITTAIAMDDDYEEPPRKSQRPGRDVRPDVPSRESSASMTARRQQRTSAIPRMQPWEHAEGRLFDPSGQWAVAWSSPYNTGQNAFPIGEHISIHRLRLGPGENHSWEAEDDEFRYAEVRSGEIDVMMNGTAIGTLTQGAMFKIMPGTTCRIENLTVLEALISVNIIGNYRRLTAC